jgi:hypothetical protein
MRLLLILTAVFTSAASPVKDLPLLLKTEEERILEKELLWAESTIENYRRKFGSLPLRSSIQAMHVHTEDWRRESISVLSSSSSSASTNGSRGNLRGST